MTTPLAPLPESIASRLADGAFLLLDKPRGPSSHQATAWVRDLLGLDTAGHAGTLDPNVSGLLWVGCGSALKLLPMMLEFPKRYVGLVRLHAPSTDEAIARAIADFTGPVYQTPPVRSAVRRERRIRTIHRLELLERSGNDLLLDIVADSGTYVRTLAVDLGEALGVDGHLEELRRIGTGPFLESASVTLPRLADAVAAARAGAPEELARALHPIEEVWREFPIVTIKATAAAALAHGADLAAAGIVALSRPFRTGQWVAIVEPSGSIVATGVALVGSKELPQHRHGWVVDARRVLVDPAHFPASWKSPSSPGGGPAEVRG